MTIEQIIAAELKVKPQQVHAALELLDGGKPARLCDSDVFLDFGYVFFEGSLSADGVYRLKTFWDASVFRNRRPVYVFNGIGEYSSIPVYRKRRPVGVV